MNKVILRGFLGRDPETKYMPSGDAVTNFSIATTEAWKDKDSGERKEKTEWHRCTAFGKRAEVIGEYLKKGSQVLVEGKLQTREWEKDGVKRYSTEIIVEQFEFLDRKPEGERGGGTASTRHEESRGDAKPAAAAKKPAGKFNDMEDDIPF